MPGETSDAEELVLTKGVCVCVLCMCDFMSVCEIAWKEISFS